MRFSFHMCLAKFKKYDSYAPLILRFFAGVIFAYSGYMKLFMMGPSAFAQMLSMLPMPMFWAWLVSLVEFVGGIALIVGLFVRWSALFLTITMIVATVMMFGAQGMMGVTAPFWGIALSLALFFTGAGSHWNLEKKWFKKEF